MIITLLKALVDNEIADQRTYRRMILKHWDQLREIGNCLQEEDTCKIYNYKWTSNDFCVDWNRVVVEHILTVRFDLENNEIRYYLNGVMLHHVEFTKENIGNSIIWLFRMKRGLNETNKIKAEI